MRVTVGLLTASLMIGVLPIGAGHVLAGDRAKPKTKISSKKTRGAAVPARPTGVAITPGPSDGGYGISPSETITESRNELGQTVYQIRASHFDISPPWSDMAAASTSANPKVDEEAGETEPRIPEARIPRSGLPDPVVQVAVPPRESLAAPAAGFNFIGVGINAGSPSDCNGSVGGNQFVETVNTRYQVWSLNRTTMTATSQLGPALINTLWAGFGGECQTQNQGDPTVLYDKTAKRWLISQFSSNYQCVAVSTSSDATGTYARYAFAMPFNLFGDYPHFGVWPPAAYYMMAHGFGSQFEAIFTAMDRTKMLAGNATATQLVILDANEGGHMPADLDGNGLPPTLAPGIFVSLHDDGMYIYRMKVSFAGSGTAVRTLQAVVPTAPATAACGGGTCIPQPGTTQLLDAISDRLMFRAAYRNLIDHESLVVSHAVDPFVPGLVSGVRWYDIRLSGAPDATCPTYPCMYQQGTIADVPGGRNRWMSSLAMDSAENILIGYTASGTANGVDNHSLRYTGRAKSDPPGTMTAPETTIATGTANNTAHSRWGDYASMSIDPSDDCTFWSVGQYYTLQNSWSTRIASARFPAGSGAGECASSTCVTRPASVPLAGSATASADNQVTLTWTGTSPASGGYAIERAEGTCANPGLARPLGAVAGTVFSLVDTDIVGGIAYSYRVRAATDATGRCQGQLANACVNVTATGTCARKPSFTGAISATLNGTSNCGVTLHWAAVASSCPLTPTVRYNVYRAIDPDFIPSPANLIAACVPGPSAYVDTDNLQSGTTYHYVVRAEDSSTGNGGPCGGGNEDPNSVKVSATPDACAPNTCPGQPDGTPCDDGVVCSGDDACAAGACSGTPLSTPPETQNLQALADKVSYAWDAMSGSPTYAVVRGELGQLPVGPGGGEEICFGGLGSAVVVDPEPPAPGTGFWYLSRATSTCGTGPYGQQTDGTPRATTTCP